MRTQSKLLVAFLWVRWQTYLYWRLNNLFLLDLLAEDRVKEERSGTVVDQPGRLFQGLQICSLLTHPWLFLTIGYDDDNDPAEDKLLDKVRCWWYKDYNDFVFPNNIYRAPYCSSSWSHPLVLMGYNIKNSQMDTKFNIVRTGAWHSDTNLTMMQSDHIW